jgi:hypothetical protein
MVNPSRSCPCLGRKGRLLNYAFRAFVVGASIAFALALYFAGVEAGASRYCDGHLRGSVFSYECYNTTILPLCFDRTEEGVRIGYGWPVVLVDP